MIIDPTITVSIDDAIHHAMTDLALNMKKKYDIQIQQIKFVWSQYARDGESDITVNRVQIITSYQPHHTSP